MIPTSSKLVLQKNFINAYIKGHPDVASSLRHYNALAEWNKIKHDDNLIKSSIEKYLSVGKPPAPTEKVEPQRKRTISSDDESPSHDPLFDPNAVVPVTPTFSKRGAARATDPDDPSKPWVKRGLERAQARVEAKLAKIESKKKARASRVKTPAQEAVIKEIEEITERIENLTQVKNMGLSTEETNFTLKRLMQQKKERMTELSLLKSKQRAGLRYRARRKQRIESLCAADPEVAAELLKIYKQSTIAVPIDDICPDVLRTLEEIARIAGISGIYNPVGPYQPCKTLDDLRMKLKERGYEIRRALTFYRLLPSGSFRDDGKKHCTSSVVRMRKIQGVPLQKHPDCHFVTASLKHIKDLAGTFGNDCVLYLVQDSRASIRLGRRAGTGHSPIMIRLDYHMSTVDGSPIPPTTRAQFKPIVYASCAIDDAGLVCPTGPTYVSIRSAKHDRMSIEWDDVDFDRVVKLREFERTARNHIGEIKPIIIMNVDRIEPKDYTRLIKTLHFAIKKFKQYNLDAFIISTQAPGQAIFNTVERRLALLTHDLSGLVLPDYNYGTHLDFHGVTIDAELEKRNFKKAGETLAEVWSMDMFDTNPVVAEYIDPPESIDEVLRSIDCQITIRSIIDQICDEEDEDLPLHQRLQRPRPSFYGQIPSGTKTDTDYSIDEYWCATHVFQTQYSIQIIRCTKPECCGPWRSNYIQVFPHRFLPSPVPFHRSSSGVRLGEIELSYADKYDASPYYGTLYQRIQFHGLVMRRTQTPLIPFDAYCPSLQNEIQSRLCSICKQYIPLTQRLRSHYNVHQQRYALLQGDIKPFQKKEEELLEDRDPIDPTDLPVQAIDFAEGGIFLYHDMVEWLKSDFEDDPIVEPKQKSIAANAMAAIRREKQLQAAFAAANAASIRFNDPTRKDPNATDKQGEKESLVESVATISLDAALSDSEKSKPETDSVLERIEQLQMNDESNSSFNLQCDSYDDLSDLIEQI